MSKKPGVYVQCSHCEATGTCRNKTIAFQKVIAIPIPVKVSCDSCIAALGGSPEKQFLVKCEVCGGSGWRYLPTFQEMQLLRKAPQPSN
jgi:hypothetical protein